MTKVNSSILLGLTTALLSPLSAATTYNFTARVEDADGDAATRDFSLTVQEAPPLAQFTVWATANITDPAQRGDLADPDGDGLSNLAEYAFNLNPTVSDATSARPVLNVAAGRLSLSFVRDSGKTDIIYLVDGGSTLTAWTDVLYDSSNPPVGLEDNNDGTRMRVEDSQAPGTNPRFLRVRVEPK